MSVALTVFILYLAGCDSADDTLIKKQQNQLKALVDQIAKLEDIIKEKDKVLADQNKEFSYLNDLKKEEQEAYEQFAQDKDSQHLIGISPEKILLIYYHSVVIDDVEAIYKLTYDDGTLPDLSTFKQMYYKEGVEWKRTRKHS
ncbi:hypothetical protein GCM10008967_37630 [Bacillus carboniphilus]|uniref:DUF4878 domain-containing protein n=1 Tax=Bacillus carboniphilus TaxID=86663 RepID=A0ABN0WPS1_9BACI